MAPLITLLTDFGTSDSYVAEVKAVLLSRALGAALVDVTHQIPPGDVRAGQYVLARVWHRFPEGTVHLVVVDPGVGTSRRGITSSRPTTASSRLCPPTRASSSCRCPPRRRPAFKAATCSRPPPPSWRPAPPCRTWARPSPTRTAPRSPRPISTGPRCGA